jgi:glutamyl-tRNA reductase
VPFEQLADALPRADIVLSSTGASRPILTCDLLRPAVHARRGRPLFLIDMAVPRDVEPAAAALEDLFLHDIDDLQSVVDKCLAVRQADVERAEAIVEEEVQRFSAWLRTQAVRPTIAALQRRAESIRAGELERLRSRLSHLSAQDFQAVEAALRATVNKLLHPPMAHLRAAAACGNGHQEVESIRSVFGLDEGREGCLPMPAGDRSARCRRRLRI